MPQPAGISKEALTFNERAGVERMKQFSDTSSAYALEHGSRPATIGLVLGSNPVSLLAWYVSFLYVIGLIFWIRTCRIKNSPNRISRRSQLKGLQGKALLDLIKIR